MIKRVILLLLVLSFLPAVSVAAPSSSTRTRKAYNEARAYYLKISKKDPSVRQLMEWERAASNILTFLKDYQHPKYTPRALFTLGRLYEHTYAKRKFRTGLTRAVYFYEKLTVQYRGNTLADDALLALGDLRRDALDDDVGARAAYYEIVDNYPKGDMLAKAKKRLGLDKKKAEQKKAETKVAAKTTDEKKVEPPKEEPKEEVKEKPKEEEKKEGILKKIFKKPWVGKSGKEIYAEKKLDRRPVIVIDPGHGGKEEGAKGVGGVLEKEVVLNISLILEEMLRERLRAKTILTRVKDVHIPLAERTAIANDNNADLFISVHANASETKRAKGIETYYLDNTNDKSSLRLAKRENAVYFKEGGSDLSFILSDLIQNAKLDDSITLSHKLQNSMVNTMSRYYKGVKNLGVKKAPFYVLVGAHMPCTLVEVSFIDHPVEGKRLMERRYQKLLAASIFEGVKEYFETR